MSSISQVVLSHYQESAMRSSLSWDAIVAEPIAQYLKQADSSCDLRKSLRLLENSSDVTKDMTHNRQFLKRHLENGQLRANFLPFLIEHAPNAEDLLHDVCELFGVLPISLKNISHGDMSPEYSLESVGKFSENSGSLTALFSKMVISEGGLGQEDVQYVPVVVKFADRVVSWANNMKLQAQQLLEK